MARLKVGITPSSFAQGDASPLEALRAAGVEVIENPYQRRLTEDEAFDYLADKDGLIAGLEPLTRNVLGNAKSLKAIARVGIGLDNVDMDAARDLGMKVSNTPDGPTDAVAELTVAMALTLGRDVLEINREMHQGRWYKKLGSALSEQTVLFIGYGRIGRKTASLMRAFGARILVVDPALEQAKLPGGEQLVELDDGLAQADVISLHANCARPILDAEKFAKCKPGVILLNSARGELVDEAALINALESEIVAAGWFDAFWQEPYQGRLLAFDNMVLTPHVGTYTGQCRLTMEMDAVRNLLKDLGLESS